METFAEFNAKRKAKWEAIKKFRRENKELQKTEYQAIRDKIQIEDEREPPNLKALDQLREQMNQHFKRWHE